MTIRKSKKEDINSLSTLILSLLKIHSRLGIQYAIKSDRACLSHIRKELRKQFKRPKGKTILIAKESDNIIGFIEFGIEKRPLSAHGDGAWIYSVYVEKKYRGREVGTNLVKEAARRLGNKGIKKIDVCYVIRNKESVNFWKTMKTEKNSVNDIIKIKRIL